MPEWNNKELILILDHINGINNDHRKENLRLLCPNCNSQTKTFAGRNVKKIRENNKYSCCTNCNKKIYKNKNNLCKKCYSISIRKVMNRPNNEQLLLDVQELGYCETGRKYGVSNIAIKKWLK